MKTGSVDPEEFIPRTYKMAREVSMASGTHRLDQVVLEFADPYFYRLTLSLSKTAARGLASRTVGQRPKALPPACLALPSFNQPSRTPSSEKRPSTLSRRKQSSNRVAHLVDDLLLPTCPRILKLLALDLFDVG